MSLSSIFSTIGTAAKAAGTALINNVGHLFGVKDNLIPYPTVKGLNDRSSSENVSSGVYIPPIADDRASAPSTADQVGSDNHEGADAYADYSNTSAYDDYLAMLQKGADVGIFSTAQDVVNEAQKDRLFQSLEAEKERSWYEDLANTSYQRQVKDLQAAGLNPILGFSNLGTGAATAHSSVPSGRATGLSAVAPNLADYLNAGANLVSSASSIVKSIGQLLQGKNIAKIGNLPTGGTKIIG